MTVGVVVAIVCDVVAAVLYVLAVRERRRVERLRGRRATPLDESLLERATERLRR